IGHRVPVNRFAKAGRPGPRRVLAEAGKPRIRAHSSRQNKLRSRIPLIEFTIDEWPWPIFETIEPFSHRQKTFNVLLPPQVKGLGGKPKLTQTPRFHAYAKRRGSSLIKTYAYDLHRILRHKNLDASFGTSQLQISDPCRSWIEPGRYTRRVGTRLARIRGAHNSDKFITSLSGPRRCTCSSARST